MPSRFLELCKKYGLGDNPTLDDIKSLRKNSARQFHPDVQFAHDKQTANDRLAAINSDCDFLVAYLEGQEIAKAKNPSATPEKQQPEKSRVEAIHQELLRIQKELSRVEVLLREQMEAQQALLNEEAVLKEQLRGVDTLSAPLTLAEYKSQLVPIPAGAFLRGSERSKDEAPQREIYLSAYQLGRTPVTVGMWQEYCKATHRKMPDPPTWGWLPDHPVVNVSWDDAKAYARWAGLSLPTEAQWEKAARGTEGREYPWGGLWDASKCANSTNLNKRTAPVGKYPAGASPYGILDMAGNVWELCADWYQADGYAHAPDRDPSGPLKGEARILRGGSWYNHSADYFRCANRYRYTPNDWDIDIGFRLASPGR